MLNLFPQPGQEPDLGFEILLRLPLGGGAHDNAHVFGLYLLHHALEARALVPALALDAPGYTHIVDGGHQHQQPPRQGHVNGHAGALGPGGLLDDLHHDLLIGF